MTTNRIVPLTLGGRTVILWRRCYRGAVSGYALACCLLIVSRADGREINTNKLVDANALVRKMMATYQSAQTFEETSEAKVKEYGKADFIQQTTLRFKRPNLLYLASEDPAIGTYQEYCSGKVLTVYSGTLNTYTKRNAPLDLSQTLFRLSKAGEDLMKLPLVQMFSPINFMVAKTMPNECKNFQYARTEMMEGSKVIVVTGQADETFLHSLGSPQGTIYDKKEITFWIGSDNCLLRKVALNLHWHVNLSGTKYKIAGTVQGGIKFEETHRNPRLNAPFRDEDFFFTPPKGAAERFQEKR